MNTSILKVSYSRNNELINYEQITKVNDGSYPKVGALMTFVIDDASILIVYANRLAFTEEDANEYLLSFSLIGNDYEVIIKTFKGKPIQATLNEWLTREGYVEGEFPDNSYISKSIIEMK